MPAAIGARRRGIGTKPKWGVDGQQYEYAALLQGRDKKFSRGWFWSLGIGGMIFNAPHLMAAFGITITETDVLDWRNDVLWTWLAAVRAKEFGCRPPLPAALVDRRIRGVLCRDRQRRAKLAYVYFEDEPGQRSAIA